MDRAIALQLFHTHTNKIIHNKGLVAQINNSVDLGLPFIHIKQKLYHIAYNLTEIPKCANPNCNNQVRWDKQNQKYPKTCSRQCSNQIISPETINKRKETNWKRYGGNAPACSNAVKLKMHTTNIERYGEEYTRVIALKSKKATQQKYGVDNISQLDDTKRKRIESSMKRFGTSHPLQNERIKAKMRKSYIDLFGRENTNQRYLSLSTIKLLNDRDFLYAEHITHQKTLTEIAGNLGVDVTTISRRLDQYNINIKQYQNKISVGEQQVYDFIHAIHSDAEQSNRTVLDGKELDIYIPSQKIAFEYCGLYWHSTAQSRMTRMYHREKLDLCEAHDIRLITIFEDEWIHNRQLIERKINHILGRSSDRVYARKTKVVEPTRNDVVEFLNKHHIQRAPKIITASYGLSYNNQLIAVMTFTKRKKEYELTRFATSVSVVGGFSKLIHHARRQIKSDFVSFADLRWSQGDLYTKNGWTLDKKLPPDYKYIEGNRLVHKFNFRHRSLAKRLTNYNPKLSEYKNMKNHNIHRVYDCGLLRFVLKNQKSVNNL